MLLLLVLIVAVVLLTNGTPGGSADGYGAGLLTGGDYGQLGGGEATGSAGLGDLSGSDQDVLARTIYGEARNQSYAGMCGVANVIINRTRDVAQFPEGAISVAAVCRQPNQFSCWNTTDPNLPIIERVQDSNSIFQRCLQIADQACAGRLQDNTGGATYYYDTTGKYASQAPSFWTSQGIRRTTTIGALVFGRVA